MFSKSDYQIIKNKKILYNINYIREHSICQGYICCKAGITLFACTVPLNRVVEKNIVLNSDYFFRCLCTLQQKSKSHVQYTTILKKISWTEKKGYHLALIDENFATYLLRTKVKSEWCVILKSTCQGTLKSKNVVATF